MNGVIDFKLAAFLNHPPHVAELKNRPGYWAKLRTALILPNQERDGETIPGTMRYYNILAFGPLAARIKEESLIVGDWLIITVSDIRTSLWFDKNGKPRAGLELLASDIDFRPPREVTAKFSAATYGSPTPVTTG
jgi:hypothetical protein